MFNKVHSACMGSLVINLRDKILHVYHIMVYSVFKMHSETFIHSECIVEGKASQSEIFHITIKWIEVVNVKKNIIFQYSFLCVSDDFIWLSSVGVKSLRQRLKISDFNANSVFDTVMYQSYPLIHYIQMMKYPISALELCSKKS